MGHVTIDIFTDLRAMPVKGTTSTATKTKYHQRTYQGMEEEDNFFVPKKQRPGELCGDDEENIFEKHAHPPAPNEATVNILLVVLLYCYLGPSVGLILPPALRIDFG